MLTKGPAKKVSIYVNEDTQFHLGPLYEALMTFLLHKGVAGATATRALSGFGSHRRMHTPKVELLAEHLPIIVEFVESAAKVDELLPSLYDMVGDGLIEVQDTTVIRSASKDKHDPEPHRTRTIQRGPAKLMRIFLGEADRWQGEPLYEAIVKRLRTMDVSGATVYRGILGYGAKGHERQESFFHISRDLPIMISVIDSAGKLAEVQPVVESMMDDGLIVLSDVDAVRLINRSEAIDAIS